MTERVFAMPDLGEGLEDGEIVEWLVAVGDDIALNQPLVEVETAKAVVEIPSPFAGRIATIHGAEGETVRVGAPLVTFELEGEVAPVGSTAGSTSVSAAVPAGDRVSTTPAVRKLARDRRIDLSTIAGTGPGGRITVDDLDRAGERVDDATEIRAASPIRREIARRLTEVATIPQVTTFRTLDCTALESFRAELAVSPLPVFIAALARTCRDHPLLNASWGSNGIHMHEAVHVGVAIDTDRGLMVPVLRDVHTAGIAGIAGEVRRLAGAARDGHLHADDLRGATIGVSNTGSYGSEAGTPLLNPGNAVTVALGVIELRALVVDGAVVARPACTISLTFDHRVLDGAGVGRALTDLVALLQDPARLRDLPR